MELRMKSGRHEYISQFTVAREKLIFKFLTQNQRCAASPEWT